MILPLELRWVVNRLETWWTAPTRRSRINRGADPETGIKLVALRSDLAPEQRPEALRIGRIGFASAGAKRKPKEAIAA